MRAVLKSDRLETIDVMMVQCWLFGLELCAGASFDAFLELLDEWPIQYRPTIYA